jgi:diaminopimelate decarboxylase
MLSDNIQRNEDGSLSFAGHNVPALARQFGTPLYLMDEERIRANCRMYIQAFRDNFGDAALPLYAGKAASFKQIYRIVGQEGMGVDAVSPGEIHTALSAGFPPEKIYYHGDAKTDEDIRYGISKGVGWFIVDNEAELQQLNIEAERQGIIQKVLLRITPGIDPHTYHSISTGTVDVKFGVALETGQGFAFVHQALTMEHLDVQGLHCHVGSEVFDESVFEDTIDIMVDFMSLLQQKLGYVTRVLNVGGGYGVRYLDTDKQIDISARIAHVAEHLKQRTGEAGLPLPFFLMEPGRSIVADAGMTVYTVSTVKRIPGYKRYAIVDGGMTDNPRYALYKSNYTVFAPERMEAPPTLHCDVVGRCCESDDIIQPDVWLPELRRGDLLAVATTGAYNYAMASHYNRIPNAPIVMLSPKGTTDADKRDPLDQMIKNHV